MRTPHPPIAPESMNREIASRLDEVADLLRDQDANTFRVQAYRSAAATVRALDEPIGHLFHREGLEGLERLPTIGPAIARAIRSMVLTGWFPMLERLRDAGSPSRVLESVPGIGPRLAERLHDELGVETLEQLELAAHDGSLADLAGFGEKKVRGIREALAGRLGARRTRRAPDPGDPDVAELLDVDREYREKSAAGRLRRITPRRFNPARKAWLPILHTQRGGRHYTVLYSNTAQAHRLRKTSDWVVIYFDGTDGERQCTVVTETKGAMKGRRVVRGRERECARVHPVASVGVVPRTNGRIRKRVRAVAVSLLLLLAAGLACERDDGERGEEHEEHEESRPGSMSFDPDDITPATLALGDSIFHGLIGAASCQACHGPDANGGPAAPSLADDEWFHSDGSFEAIYNTVRNGVFTPKQFSSVMLPNGGAALTPEQTRAVAAYVYTRRQR